MAGLLERLDEDLREIFLPPDSRFVWKWAEDEITLSLRQTETPGPYSSVLTPYVREPLECFKNRGIRSATMVWATQTSKSTVVMLGTAYAITNRPAPIVWVMPNETLAGSFSENRWQPMVDDCRPLKERIVPDRHKFKRLEQQFLDCTVTFVGSNSPANLASRPAGILIMDEVDKFAKATDAEASALALAENRTKSYTAPLIVKTSTPTTIHGEIWKEFLKGDQRYYHVPCPHCGEFIKLEWGQVKWDQTAKGDDGKWDKDKVRTSAFYQCQKCDGQIRDGQKTMMLRKGEWRASNPNAELGNRSYHLNSLYAPWRSCSFGALAVKFLEAKETINGLQDFVNSTLAEPWDEDIANERTPLEKVEYSVTEKWDQECARFLTNDVQESGGRHYWTVARAWSRSGESRLLWEGKLSTFEEIKAKQDEFGIKVVGIDIAYSTNEICQAALRYGWLGMWGSDKPGFPWRTKSGKIVNRIFSKPQYRDAGLGTESQGMGRAKYIHWSNDGARDALEKLKQLKLFKVPPWVSQEYEWHLGAYVRKVKRNPMTGREKPIWHKSRKDDHLQDCELMQIILATAAGLVRLSEADTAELDTQ